MLNIIYADNKISANVEDSVYVIKSDKDDIELKGIIPVYSYVTLRVVADDYTIVVPMEFKTVEDELTTFKTKLYLTDFDINKLIKSSKIYLRLFINQAVIPGKINLDIHPGSIARCKTNNESVLIPLSKDLICMKARLDSYMNQNYKFDKTNVVKKGMVPVATDSFGNYVWDFPFNATEKIVSELTQLVARQAGQITNLINRVTELETQVLDHINESYYI